MPTGHYRFRRSLGNVSSNFRGARPDTYPRFTGLLDTYGGAAAAYSLRALSSGWLAGDVVEVRRASDSATDTFTASQITSGAMTTWVNAVNVARNRTGGAKWSTFTATSTGFNGSSITAAACGYDLLGSNTDEVVVSFDVIVNSGSFTVSLRSGFEAGSSVSNAEAISTSGSKSFTLTATSDFEAIQFISANANIEITNFTINTPWTNDGFVSTWYDQSGQGNDATQPTTTAQPKIVSAGSLVTGGLDFDGVDDYLNTSVIPPSTATLIGVATWDVEDAFMSIIGARDSTDKRSYIAQISSGKTALGVAGGPFSGSDVVAGDDYLLFGTYSGSTRLLSTNGSVVSDSSGSSPNNTIQGYSIGAINSAGVNGSFMNGRIQELIVYDSDQSANRAAIEANINDFYSIY